MNWPSEDMQVYRSIRPRSVLSWVGNVIEQSRDASWLMYMRNRYYDPISGRFTQEDPIGLAGGMNLYGFAAGDPINHSDPFGLCPVVLALAGPAGAAVAAGWCIAEVATIGTGVWLATKQAKGIQRTETSLGIAEEHLGRIGGLGPDDEDPDGKKRDWLKDANKHLNNAKKYVKDVKGKTKEELQRRLDEVARQIDRLSSPQ